MPDAVAPTPPRKRHRLLRVLAWGVVILIVVLVIAYLTVTSGAFFKGVVLSRVSKVLNADVTVEDASIQPFSQVVLRGLKVQPKGAEPLVTAVEVRARYHLIDIISGNINVAEVTLTSPVVTIVKNPDGTSNLDPLFRAQQQEKKEEKKPRMTKPSKPAQINLQKVALSNATIRVVKYYKDGFRDIAELSNVNFTVADLKNAKTGNLDLSASIKIDNNPPPPGTNGSLQATLAGHYDFALSSDLKPVSITGRTALHVTEAGGAMQELRLLAVDLNSEVTPTDIKQVALRFRKGEATLGQLRASGPFDLEKAEGRLSVEILSIDRQVLNLVGAASGIDFGTTTINSTNQIEFAKGGSLIIAAGKLDAAQVRLTRQGQTTPTLDASVNYDVTVDRTAKSALLRTMTLTGTQNQQPLLRAELTSPMSLAWGNVANSVGDSALNFTVANLNLADWRPFVGEHASGVLNLAIKLLSQQGGKKLTFDLNAQAADLAAKIGSNSVRRAEVTLEASGVATDLKKFDLARCRMIVGRSGRQLLSLSGSGTYDTVGQMAELQLALEATLVNVVEGISIPDLSATAGKLNLTAHVTQKAQSQTLVGNLALADFTGQFKDYKFQNFGANADLDIAMAGGEIQIRKTAGALRDGQNAGGTFEITGKYDQDKKSGQINLKLADFNQNGLRPFLESMLKEKRLETVALNGNFSASYDPGGDSALKGNLHVANLVVSDPQKKFPATPLEAKFQVDTALHKQVAEVRQFQITLTPTTRAKNELQLQGRVDMSQTNAIQGALKLTADSFDVTAYYDLFAGEPEPPGKKNAARTPATPATAPAAEPKKEPEAIKLPIRDLTFEANIGRFFLREVEITNLQATAKIEGSHVVIKPLQLALNGAAVSANVDLNLGVPGYIYDVSLNGKQIPLAPLVNSFQPDRKGQIGGAATAQIALKGAGITDPSLQKSLSGQFDFASTNLNLAIPNLRSKWLKEVINFIAQLPNLIRNPEATVVGLLERVIGNPAERGGGVLDELMQSPIDSISGRGTIGNGKMDVERVFVQSPAFQTEVRGVVNLAPVLTNSTMRMPVSIALRRPLAEKIGVASGTSTNVDYVKLPDLLTLKGSISDPKRDINKAGLLALGAKVTGSGVGGTAGNILQGLGGLLGGQPSANTNQPSNVGTNRPQTNQPQPIDLLDLFKKPKKK